MQLDSIRSLVEEDFQAVDHLISAAFQSKASIINNLGNYITQSGGKRIRPLVVLLLTKACQYSGHQHTTLAAIIELIHTATLLHDDVVDNAPFRRGKETANSKWGNEAAVLVGDYLYSKAFQMLAAFDRPAIMNLLTDATNTMAEGEALQLLERYNANITEQDYLNIIRCKTAKLFEVSAQLSGILSQVNPTLELALAEYGLHLGTAFQLMDDILDYDASLESTGKKIGNDLAEGKVTLPLIYILQNGKKEEMQIIQTAIQEGGYHHLPIIQEIILSSGAIDHTKRLAKVEAAKAKAALAQLKPSSYCEAAITLADFAIERDY